MPIFNAIRRITKKCYRDGGRSYFSSYKKLPAIQSRFDFTRLEKNLEEFETGMKHRRINKGDEKLKFMIQRFKEYKTLLQEVNILRQERNQLSLKGKNNKPTEEDISKGKTLKNKIQLYQSRIELAMNELDKNCLPLPNWIDPSTPRTTFDDDCEGIIINSSNSKPKFEFKPLNHIELANKLDLVDWDAPVMTSGPKFMTFKNEAVLLELALTQWVINRLINDGFTPMMTPELVHSSVLEGCGFQPRGDSNHVYKVSNEGESHRELDLCLVGTSEIALAGSKAGSRFRNHELPLRLCSYGHCFRAEAGSSGTHGKGLYRLHQFSKTEMFIFCIPKDSEKELDRLLKIQEDICKDLGLHWQTIDMFPHELGNPASRKFDVQVYMPSRNGYGEVASISNCTDYQARRLDIRYNFPKELGGERGFVYTLNGTAIAIPRIILSILETHQQKDGSVKIPECLWNYMPNKIIRGKT